MPLSTGMSRIGFCESKLWPSGQEKPWQTTNASAPARSTEFTYQRWFVHVAHPNPWRYRLTHGAVPATPRLGTGDTFEETAQLVVEEGHISPAEYLCYECAAWSEHSDGDAESLRVPTTTAHMEC